MKSLRRSFNNNNNGGGQSPGGPLSPPMPHSAPIASGSGALGKPSEKVAPPQKVIKALVSKRSNNPQELSYVKGDFWYVTGEQDVWYEALNPLTGSRGLVPKMDFEEFAKGGRPAGGADRPPSSAQAGRSHTPSLGQTSQASSSRSPPAMSPPEMPKKAYQPLYAIVQYDFSAERPDELDAKQGEPIVIIAQSNHEWFVAKPIGRLGGPGLIPVAFVQIRDTATGKPMDTVPDSIPLVEEWKKATADYKAASIPLGTFDFAPEKGVQDSPYAHAAAQSGRGSGSQSAMSMSRNHSSVSVNGARAGTGRSPHYRPEQDPHLPPGDFVSLTVPSFHNESGNYWFRLQVTYLPDEPSAPGYSLSLYRTYEDFYDFQITLLDTFPIEAGREGRDDGEEPVRILPFMPGPVDEGVDDELTVYRRDELDSYVHLLLELRAQGAGYILRHELVRAFFTAKYGDYCEDIPRPTLPADVHERGGMEELDERVEVMRLDDGRATGHGRSHSRNESIGFGRQSPSDRSQHPSAPSRTGSSRNPSPLPPIDTSRPTSGSGGSRGGSGPGHARQPSNTAGYSAHGMPSSAGSYAQPGSAGGSAGGQPPYVKIKVYDRSTDDLIALRVHPNVSHAELFDKVRSRLGNEVRSLRYRVGVGSGSGAGSGQGGYVEIEDDRGLKEWMRGEDNKLVLYAEQ